jgi:hypothetical protein
MLYGMIPHHCSEEKEMMKIFMPAAIAALVTMAMPLKVHAYGAAHVGYTHVGPAGAYHVGGTAARGYGGYRGGYNYGGAYGGYRGGYGYSAAAYGGAYGTGMVGRYNAAAAVNPALPSVYNTGYPYVPSYYYGAPGYPYVP